MATNVNNIEVLKDLQERNKEFKQSWDWVHSSSKTPLIDEKSVTIGQGEKNSTNVAKLLKKYAKEGDLFYCTMLGIVRIKLPINDDDFYPIDITDYSGDSGVYQLREFGNWSKKGECVIFPTINQRDWSVWAYVREYNLCRTNEEYFNSRYHLTGNHTKTLDGVLLKDDDVSSIDTYYVEKRFTIDKKYDFETYQMVIVRTSIGDVWNATIYNRRDTNGDNFVIGYETAIKEGNILPYDEFKHLIGTMKEP